VIDHVLAHLDMPIRVEDLAGVTRLSTSHFSRAFKLSFHVSPHAYVIALRLARARALMLESDEQMSQIAAACGFADQAHFSRAFRRKTGCAPGFWRRERRGQLDREPVAPIAHQADAEEHWFRLPDFSDAPVAAGEVPA
jgi:transcriptional regulator GlxA family with amidase domain